METENHLLCPFIFSPNRPRITTLHQDKALKAFEPPNPIFAQDILALSDPENQTKGRGNIYTTSAKQDVTAIYFEKNTHTRLMFIDITL